MTAEALQVCTFRIDDFYFGIPIHRIREVVRSSLEAPVPGAPPAIRGLINLRGELMPVVELRRCLRLAPAEALEEPMNIVLDEPEDKCAIFIDEIGDVIWVQPDQFEPPPHSLKETTNGLLRGVYKLDGQLLLELDVDALLHMPMVRAGR